MRDVRRHGYPRKGEGEEGSRKRNRKTVIPVSMISQSYTGCGQRG